MLPFILRRILTASLTLLLVSAVAFFVIRLAPGSFLDAYLQDPKFSPETVERIKNQLGLDRSPIEQYGRWLGGALHGDFGLSFVTNAPVSRQIAEKLFFTVEVTGLAFLFAWLVAIPLGILAATRRNSWLDGLLGFLGYVGLAIPDFLLALILIALILRFGGKNVGGLFSNDFIDAPWSFAKFLDHLNHLWLPVLVLGVSRIAALQRQMRGSMLDVLNQDYVRTAKAKGLSQRLVVYRHAVRNAINPLVSVAGLSFPELINGAIIASIILNLPTIGPMLYNGLLDKDQNVVMALLVLSSVLLLVGNLISDVVLGLVDPRIRFE